MSNNNSISEAAFPFKINKPEGEFTFPGLTKREWFAGMALAEILRLMGAAKNEDIARQCFGIAGAMIEASKK